ncbi:MAG TPA: FadR/GntR family transcriptional regulator [Bacillota bacterium]|jgi:GntR family transcriptional repressor for pyruvate dehydrogenase complex|nr:FadR/GntR family transcriptional regulator [Bacillota bacterium]HOO30130.1 FadR/GntR family transcriptional regulator [Bacillota bacterium]
MRLQGEGVVQKIEHKSVSQQVEEAIKRYIVQKGLRTGDRLPTERELAEMLGVSRSSVREAIVGLQALGIVESKPKVGITVSEPNVASLIHAVAFNSGLNTEKIFQLNEARLVLETAALKLAVEKADQSDYEAMAETIYRMEAKVEAGESCAAEDLAFHQAIVEATHNPILSQSSHTLQEFFHIISAEGVGAGVSPARILSEHKEIYNAFRQKNVGKCEELMTRHLQRYYFAQRQEGDTEK